MKRIHLGLYEGASSELAAGLEMKDIEQLSARVQKEIEELYQDQGIGTS